MSRQILTRFDPDKKMYSSTAKKSAGVRQLLQYSFDVACTFDVFSVADQAWQLLKLYLDRLGSRDGHVHYRCVTSKLLSAGAALPTWLVNDYKVSLE